MANEKQRQDARAERAAGATAVDALMDLLTVPEDEKDVAKGALTELIGDFSADEHAQKLDKFYLADQIAKCDELVSLQVAAIMQHPDFKRVEATWRGLFFLVQRTDFSSGIQIDVVQATKEDLLADLNVESIELSHIYKLAYRDAYDQPGGVPYGSIIGDYQFGSSGQDIQLLSLLSSVSQAAHSPFLAAVGPEFYKKSSWREVLQVPNIEPYLETKDFAEWKTFRERESARYVGLTMPRFVLREPYGPHGIKIKDFDFREVIRSADDYLWGNAVWPMASKLTESFANDGWIARIAGGKNAPGVVKDLSVIDYVGATEACKIATETMLSSEKETAFSEAGFLPFTAYINEALACFFDSHSAQKPAQYTDPSATKNAELGAKLAYMYPIARVAHYLKKIQTNNIGRFATAQSLEGELSRWLKQYTAVQTNLPQDLAARYPFVAYGVRVVEHPSRPGWFNLDVWVQPRIQMVHVEGKLHLVAEVPAKKE